MRFLFWIKENFMNMRLLRLLSAGLPVAVLLGVLAISWTVAQGDTVLVTYKYDRAGRLIQADYGTSVYFRYLYDQAGNLTDHEVTGPVIRNLRVNYNSGGVGSYITLHGSGFPAGGYVRLSVNQVPLSPPVQCNASGEFEAVFFFNGSDPGLYIVEALAVSDPNLSRTALRDSQGVWPSVTIFISSGGDVRPQESQASLISIPAGLAQEPWPLFLPLISR
jgi:YD repeat-containing protein